ncbi:hypothetical protein GF343_03185 [Candidatus Woesearchaeota archaeon]|nr:hypothetical protein [Candidatus Woesearchaeota archaeon]
MGLFRRKKVDNAKEVDLTAVRLNPEVDMTIDNVLQCAETPESVHRKYFGSREKMTNELAVAAHNNLWGFILDGKEYQPNLFLEVGFDEDRKQWYADMPDYGIDDFERIKSADNETAKEIITKCAGNLARMDVAAPDHLFDRRKFKRNGHVKKHGCITKLIEALDDEGISFSKKTLRRAANALDPILGESFDYDSWLGNFIGRMKIDEDKSGPVAGWYNLAFLLEGTDALTEEQVDELKQYAFTEINRYIEKKNAVVRRCHANAKETMLMLIDTCLPEDMGVVQKIRKKIERKSPMTLKQYMKMLNKKALKGKMYLIESFIENLEETPNFAAEDFNVMYNAGNLLRSAGTFSNYHTLMKNAEQGSDDELFYAINKQDQLEKAIAAADWIINSETVDNYTSSAASIKKYVSKLNDTLVSAHKQIYMRTSEQTKAKKHSPLSVLMPYVMAEPVKEEEYAATNA